MATMKEIMEAAAGGGKSPREDAPPYWLRSGCYRCKAQSVTVDGTVFTFLFVAITPTIPHPNTGQMPTPIDYPQIKIVADNGNDAGKAIIRMLVGLPATDGSGKRVWLPKWAPIPARPASDKYPACPEIPGGESVLSWNGKGGQDSFFPVGDIDLTIETKEPNRRQGKGGGFWPVGYTVVGFSKPGGQEDAIAAATADDAVLIAPPLPGTAGGGAA